MPRAPLTSSLALALLLAGSACGLARPGGPTSYTLPSEPEAVVLRVQGQGPMTGWTSTLTLHADGRLETLLLDRDHTTVLKSSTLTLSSVEMDAVFSDVLDARLLELDQETVNRDLQALLGTTNVSEDDGVMTLELHVADFTRDGVSLGPRQTLLAFDGPATLAHAAPTFAPVTAFVRIYQRLYQAEKDAQPNPFEAPR